MRFAVAVAMLAWAVQFSGPAAADLYRWVDPDTGSVKFSSYPPPWHGDPARERRAPKVEVIPERSSAPSSGPKPEPEARPEPRSAARPADKTPDKPAAGLADGVPDKPAVSLGDGVPDKPAATPPAKREPAPMKEGSADAR